MPQCDSCGERRHKVHVVLVNDGVELICDECDQEVFDEALVASEYEDAISNGEPWAIPDNEELWNSKYKEHDATTDK